MAYRFEWVVAISCIAILTACGDSDPGASQEFVVRDSAGVRISDNVEPVWAAEEGWRLSDTARLTIGVESGDPAYQLWRMAGARRLSDGTIVIADGGSLELRFFAPDGTHLASRGGSGEGPGEFVTLARVYATPADTLVAFDGALQRVSIFGPDGDFVRSLQLPQLDDRIFPRPRGSAFADGSLLAYTERGINSATMQEGGMLVRDPGLWYRFDTREADIEVLGELPIRGYVFHPRAGNMLIPFEPHPWPVAAGDTFFFGPADRFEIGVYDRAGELRRSIRWRKDPEPVTADDVEEFLRSQLDRIEDEQERSRMDAMLREVYPDITLPRTKPSFSDLKVDDAGNLWAAEYRPPGTFLDTWFVFDVEGRLLGPVHLPDGLQIEQIGDDFVLARTEDELGVERVALYELVKPDDGAR